MNIAVTWSTVLIIAGAVGAFLGFRRMRATERQLMTIAMLAVIALGVVGVARATGYLTDRNLYVTLNIALPVLFLAMTYQVYLRRKQNTAAR
ncbi:MAG: hypothetical protein M3P00_07715 [Gemmatimonadota bacterium]|nr:hypothetical protein [Gemmatimonadota bacterium]